MGSRRWVWVAGGVVVLLAAGGVGAFALIRQPPASASTSDVSTVDRGAVSLAVATTGAVTPAESYALGFATTGTVSVVTVRPGDRVTKGQVLARVDDTDATATVDAAQTAADRANDELDAAQKAATACATRARTTAPTPHTAAPHTTPPHTPAPHITAPRTATPTTRATPTAAPARDTPTRPAVATTGASPTARGGGCAASDGTDPVLRARRQVTAANLALDEARDALAATTLRAPIAGTVLTVTAAVGAGATPGGTAVTLADPGGMQVRAAFPEADAGRLATGQAATVTLPDRPDTPLAATVVQVDPVGANDGTLVTFGARLAFDKAPGDLLVGQSAAVRITIASRPDVLRVPSTAVRADGSVLVHTAAGNHPAQVGVGLRGDAYTEISAGLIDGQEIVTASS